MLISPSFKHYTCTGTSLSFDCGDRTENTLPVYIFSHIWFSACTLTAADGCGVHSRPCCVLWILFGIYNYYLHVHTP